MKISKLFLGKILPLVVVVIFLLTWTPTRAQGRTPYLFPQHVPTRYPVPLTNVREADCIWSKRVWRSIDLREKINHPLYYPLDQLELNHEWSPYDERWSLWSVLRYHIFKGNLIFYSPYNPNNVFGDWDGDQFKYPVLASPGGDFLTDSTFRSTALYYFGYLGEQSDIPLVDDFGEPLTRMNKDSLLEFVYPDRDTIYYTAKDIIQYHIKEDWFFDRERGQLDVRILGLAPVVHMKELVDGKEQILGTKELFWVYFPHARFYLCNHPVFNEANDAQWMSFDDLFLKRRFSSVIYKESNVMNRSIETYKMGEEALRESNRIEEEIRNIEHDIWKF